MIKDLVIPAFVDPQEWAACFGLSWADLLLADQARQEPLIMRSGGMYLREVAGTMGVAEARNSLVRTFLEATEGEWLFMIDTDMGFGPDIVDRLIASARRYETEIVGGLAFALKGKGKTESPFHARRYRIQPTMYRYVDTGTERGFLAYDQYERDAVQFVDGTGAACLMMHRDALEALVAAHPSPFRPMVVRGANPDGTDRVFGEDLSFCARAAGIGLSIAVDTAAKTTHYKTGIFLDEETFMAQQAVTQRSPLGVPPLEQQDADAALPAWREAFGAVL